MASEATRCTAGQELDGIVAPSASCALAAPIMHIAELRQPLIGRTPVSDDRGARLHVVQHEFVQRLAGPIGHRRDPTPTQPPGRPDLYGDASQNLLALGAPTCQPRLGAADVGLVHLDRPAQQFTPGTHHHRAQPMQHRPGGLVRADFQHPLQAQRRDPILARDEQPAGREPHGQRRPGPVEDRTCRHRTASTARRTFVPPVAQTPAIFVSARRTHEAIGPPQPRQIVHAVCIAGEPGSPTDLG